MTPQVGDRIVYQHSPGGRKHEGLVVKVEPTWVRVVDQRVGFMSLAPQHIVGVKKKAPTREE